MSTVCTCPFFPVMSSRFGEIMVAAAPAPVTACHGLVRSLSSNPSVARTRRRRL
jgi:hypothetical protein